MERGGASGEERRAPRGTSPAGSFGHVTAIEPTHRLVCIEQLQQALGLGPDLESRVGSGFRFTGWVQIAHLVFIEQLQQALDARIGCEVVLA
eukprot:scaffold4050_cov131-Isochrysis_galbana.AAC.1